MPEGGGCESLRELQMVVREVSDDDADEQSAYIDFTAHALVGLNEYKVQGYKHIDI
jgi:hypothetical protein